ncbi:MAG: hypothetical protein GC184_07525 [Rhizobiales bacterium]|nr:hypothetical protein [Hyphomicrobiales bacterium]
MARSHVLATLVSIVAMTAAPAFAGNLYETLKADPQFSTLVSMIDANGVKFRYTDSSPRTVFAPTNAALAAQPGGVDDMVNPQNDSVKQNAQALLLYQIVPGRYTPENLAGKVTESVTLQRGKVRIDGTVTPIHFGGSFGANISGDAITADNGVIIPVDRLPIPVFEDGTPSGE